MPTCSAEASRRSSGRSRAGSGAGGTEAVQRARAIMR